MEKKKFKLIQGNNLEKLKTLPENSIDSIVTDPPYGLSFMNNKWDYDVPSVDFWKEALRVLKPGGHVLSFGGTRTYHRMVVNMEDAGFEIRDQIMWIYGSGFPKSLNIGKAVDKLEGNKRKVIADGIDYKHEGAEDRSAKYGFASNYKITRGTSKFEGWGTALKPANEPICLARKPLSEKSVAENALKWKTGGINIDATRIDTNGEIIQVGFKDDGGNAFIGDSSNLIKNRNYETPTGRFPANIILDETAADVLDEQSGISKSNCKSGTIEGKVANVFNDGEKKTSGHKRKIMIGDYNDKGGASRFFYVAKVSKKERNMGLDGFEETESQQKGHGLDRICMNEGCGVSMLKPELCKCETPDWRTRPKKNSHPTVKPINLLTYLCKLITPENGIILDPFMGSGSTGIAAQLEGFRFCGMELSEDYFKIAETRIQNWEQYREILK